MRRGVLVAVLVALALLVASTDAFLGGLRGGKLLEAARLASSKKALAADPLPTDIDRDNLVKHHSFDPPLLEDFPWSSGLVHWDFGLSAAATDAYVRLTPNKQSREGYLWNDQPCYLKSWTANIGFRVHSLNSLGGDGFAFWYSDKRSVNGGPLFGASDKSFKGLGIIIDSFDNDGGRDNPAVHVIVGNGDDYFDVQSDFKQSRLAGCTFDFRNTGPTDVVRLMVEYDPDSGLQVTLSSSRQQTVCATIAPLTLPEGYFFGFTAHTGHLADNHDIHYFAVTASAADRQQEAESAAAAESAERAQAVAEAPASGVSATGAPSGAASKVYSHDDEKREKQKWSQ